MTQNGGRTMKVAKIISAVADGIGILLIVLKFTGVFKFVWSMVVAPLIVGFISIYS